MGAAIGESLPFAIGVALSAMAIIAVVLMLLTPRARITGSSFLAGWILGIAVSGAVLLVLAKPTKASDKGQPATWVDWLDLALGLVLVWVALRQWRKRPAEGEDVAIPKWMGALGGFTPLKAAGLGVFLSALNIKNLVFIISAATAVAATGISAGKQTVAWIVFTLVASVGVGAPVVIYFAMGARAAGILDGVKVWMARNNTVILAVLCLVLGVKRIGDAITGLTS